MHLYRVYCVELNAIPSNHLSYQETSTLDVEVMIAVTHKNDAEINSTAFPSAVQVA